MKAVVSDHIEVTPEIAGGKPRIAGHRIRVQDIVVWHERCGYSPEEIVDQHPGISLSDVYAALSYYHDHREEIRRDIDNATNLAESMRQKTSSLLLKKLGATNGGPDSLPS